MSIEFTALGTPRLKNSSHNKASASYNCTCLRCLIKSMGYAQLPADLPFFTLHKASSKAYLSTTKCGAPAAHWCIASPCQLLCTFLKCNINLSSSMSGASRGYFNRAQNCLGKFRRRCGKLGTKPSSALRNVYRYCSMAHRHSSPLLCSRLMLYTVFLAALHSSLNHGCLTLLAKLGLCLRRTLAPTYCAVFYFRDSVTVAAAQSCSRPTKCCSKTSNN